MPRRYGQAQTENNKMNNRKFKQSLHDKIMYWIYPSMFLLSSIFLLYKLNFTNWYELGPKTNMTKNHIQIIAFILFLISIYLIRKMLRYSKFTQVESKELIESKEIIVKKLAENFDWSNNNSNNAKEFNFFQNKYFKYNCRISILIEIDGFYINVQDIYQWAPFDFGMNERVAKKIKNKIIELLEDKKASH